MKISKQGRAAAKELFRSCLADGVLDENRVRQCVQKMLAVKPRAYLPILTHFQRLVKLEMDRRTARVESAAALPAELQETVKAFLTKAHGPGLRISFEQNPVLIGGMRIRVGSDVYDGSVQARLAALQESL